VKYINAALTMSDNPTNLATQQQGGGPPSASWVDSIYHRAVFCCRPVVPSMTVRSK
jgi:hypothetical protein